MYKYIVYAKIRDMKRFSCFDLSEGDFAGNIIRASWVEDSERLRAYLQKTADNNKGIDLVFQLRYGDKIHFQTH